MHIMVEWCEERALQSINICVTSHFLWLFRSEVLIVKVLKGLMDEIENVFEVSIGNVSQIGLIVTYMLDQSLCKVYIELIFL